jgi:hypothetical protein
MPKAIEPNTTPAPDDLPWTIGDVEPLLHDMEAAAGILSHVANSRNQIEPGELILIEDKFIDLHKQMMTLWHTAWDEHLAFRHGASRPIGPDAVWDLLRSTAKVVLDQCNHPARLPSAPAHADSSDAELIQLCDQLGEVYDRWTAAVSASAQHVRAPAPLAAATDAADAAVWAIADWIEGITPTTPAGLQAKARAAILVWSSGEGETGIPDDSRLAALARSILISLAG